MAARVGGAGSLGGLQDTGGNNTWSGNLTMTADSVIGATTGTTLTASGTVASSGGAYNPVKTDAGTLALSGTNSYTGSTTVSGGTLQLSNNLALQNSALNTSGSGVLGLSAVTIPVFGGLTGSADLASVITTGYGSLTALSLNPGSGASNTYSGAIADGAAGMSLTKIGAGTQILSGANTYTGTTTIGGGTLALGVNTQTLGLLTITANAVFNFGGSGGTLTFGNSSAQTWSGTLTITNYSTASNSLYFGSNGSGLTPTQLSLLRFADYGNVGGQIDAFGLVTPSAIPEPATWAAIAGAVALVGAVLRRRRMGTSS